MTRVGRRGATALALSLVVSACSVGMGGLGQPDPGTFTATLAPAPGVETEAGGTATFTFDSTSVAYEISVSDLEGANAAHIHHGETDIVMVPFHVPEAGADSTGVLAEGTFTADDVIVSSPVSFNEMIRLMRTGGVYVNVHTEEEPGGEIRGDITASQTAAAG